MHKSFKVTRNCFICEKQLKSACGGEIEHDFYNPPDGALVFQTKGNYGSNVFDNGNDYIDNCTTEYLEISICDGCVRKRARYVTHALEVKQANKTISIATFQPPPEEY